MRCPLLNKECLKEKCEWWSTVQMKNLHTQEPYQESKCVIHTIGPMLIELIKNTGGVQAAVENSRNETLKRQDVLLNIMGNRLIS